MQTNMKTNSDISTMTKAFHKSPSIDSTGLKAHQNEFSKRHIGPDEKQQKEMLQFLGFASLEEMITKIVPKSIYTTEPMNVGNGRTEKEILAQLKSMMGQNKIYESMIGLGYHDTITPSVILRNVFENPVWYTAYTPYQPEISQGRLESLLNFQTAICDLTGMEIANASLLDEGTAAAEALMVAHSVAKNKSDTFIASPFLHAHVLEVLKTRSEPLGLKMIVAEPTSDLLKQKPFAIIVSYPQTYGAVCNYKNLTDEIHALGGLVIADSDLLALTVLTPPGEWGADLVVGNSQRFGVPLGFGGPHAAFLATKETYKRNIPGRLVGVSVDQHGHRALRLTLQTREQHIRREKATSNICTAQVLLANMAAMYAIYHGPKGLTEIATRTHRLAQTFVMGLLKLGYTVAQKNYFDTVFVPTNRAQELSEIADAFKMNLLIAKDGVSVSFNETSTLETVDKLLTIFNFSQPVSQKAEQLYTTLNQNLALDSELVRKSAFLTHPTFNRYQSETELMRYIYSLQNKDITLTHSMIPLGSCTMKLNAATELIPVSWPEINKIHPFAPLNQAKGYLELIQDLEQKLCAITGFHAVSLQPNSGAQGEYAGLLVIREYFRAKNEAHRNICLIPSSAHGTNPASAVMAGFEVVVTACDENGNVDIQDLKAKADLHKDKLAALMVTYPSTHGVFEQGIKEICEIIHARGGQVYMDGANLNALVGLARPGQFGPDVSHMNLHKTFAIPHGGGGPGVGPIGVAKHLAPYLPQHKSVPDSGPNTGVSSTTSAPWGSASILPISWSYITMMGDLGLRHATLVSILNANYMAKRLAPHYPIVYKGQEGLVAHECIIDVRPLKKSHEIDVTDIAKRLMDYGFHAPTMSWPVIGTLMIEPTESESKSELDRFCDAMIQIRQEADTNREVIRNAPHTAQSLMSNDWKNTYTREQAAYPMPWLRSNKYWPPVGRVDNAYGDKNVYCTCPPLDEYK